jgi:excisionase family DNA binding protein
MSGPQRPADINSVRGRNGGSTDRMRIPFRRAAAIHAATRRRTEHRSRVSRTKAHTSGFARDYQLCARYRVLLGGKQPEHVPPRQRREVRQSDRPEDEISALIKKPNITATDLAKFLRVSKMTVHRAIKEGSITGVIHIIGRTIRLPSWDVR